MFSQLVHQNPTLFQFREFYLESMAYHVYSGRFSTFLLDSELERIESGIFEMDADKGVHCFWNYINKAIEPDDVSKEINIKLVNISFNGKSRETIFPNSDLSYFEIFNLFGVKPVSAGTCYDNLSGETSIEQEEVNYLINFAAHML